MGWPASFPRIRVGGAPGLLATATAKIELDPIRTDERQRQTYGKGECYERYFYVSYGVLTEIYVLLKRSTEIRLRMNGNLSLYTRTTTMTMLLHRFHYFIVPCPRQAIFFETRQGSGQSHICNDTCYFSHVKNYDLCDWLKNCGGQSKGVDKKTHLQVLRCIDVVGRRSHHSDNEDHQNTSVTRSAWNVYSNVHSFKPKFHLARHARTQHDTLCSFLPTINLQTLWRSFVNLLLSVP